MNYQDYVKFIDLQIEIGRENRLLKSLISEVENIRDLLKQHDKLLDRSENFRKHLAEQIQKQSSAKDPNKLKSLRELLARWIDVQQEYVANIQPRLSILRQKHETSLSKEAKLLLSGESDGTLTDWICDDRRRLEEKNGSINREIERADFYHNQLSPKLEKLNNSHQQWEQDEDNNDESKMLATKLDGFWSSAGSQTQSDNEELIIYIDHLSELLEFRRNQIVMWSFCALLVGIQALGVAFLFGEGHWFIALLMIGFTFFSSINLFAWRGLIKKWNPGKDSGKVVSIAWAFGLDVLATFGILIYYLDSERWGVLILSLLIGIIASLIDFVSIDNAWSTDSN